MHRSRYVLSLVLGLLVAATCAAFAVASSGKSNPHNFVIVAKDGGATMSPNRYVQDNMSFAPGTLRVRSGDTITFRYDKPGAMEPHTLTIVKKSDLPRTGDQAENCTPCQMLAAGHLRHPGPPDQSNPIVHWMLNKGAPGLDTVGDSLAIQEPGAHKSITVKVSAPAGTTLYFLCVPHPWMQGKIIVT